MMPWLLVGFVLGAAFEAVAILATVALSGRSTADHWRAVQRCIYGGEE